MARKGSALRFAASTYQSDPGAAAPVCPTHVEEQEGGGHDKAEHRDKHHPAQHYGMYDLGGGDEDPDKAPKDLQAQVGERVSVG